MPAIQSSVMPALRLRGSLKAVMPFEIASTPVRAVVPLEKACRSRNTVTACVSPMWSIGGGSATRPSVPVQQPHEADARPSPHVIADEEVGRDGEEVARLAHPAQVDDHDHDHQATAKATRYA